MPWEFSYPDDPSRRCFYCHSTIYPQKPVFFRKRFWRTLVAAAHKECHQQNSQKPEPRKTDK
jgi:hypothetical protein